MNTTGMVIRAQMRGVLSYDEADTLLDAALRTENQIQCPMTGMVIDTSTSLMLEIRIDEHSPWTRPTRFGGKLNIYAGGAREQLDELIERAAKISRDPTELARVVDVSTMWGKVRTSA